jgi:phage terminase large subunit-like protein
VAREFDSKWIRTDADKIAVSHGCWFDEYSAMHVKNFIARFLRHSKGEWAGQPFELQAWQWDQLIAPLFGWMRDDGTRRYRRAYVEVPKKNGKSTLCSAISLYMLMMDGEPGAEVYNAAADRDQASIVFNEAANMVEASMALASRLDVLRSTKRIVYTKESAVYRALSAEVPTKEGINWHCLIFDELHAQRTRELWDTLAYGGAARRQPLSLAITTAGYDRHSICWEQHDYALKVRDGIIEDDAFFPLIYAAADDDDWKSEQVWRAANPSYGVTVKADSLAADCREAQQSPGKENAFRRYRLNQWTEQDVRWIPIEKWDTCEIPYFNTTECFAGLDLANTIDISALVLAFPVEDGYDLRSFFWVPQENVKLREVRDRVPYAVWIREGLIKPTEGTGIDYAVIRNDIRELAEQYHMRSIAIDRWNATQLAQELQGDGFEVVMFGQGYSSMSAAAKEFERHVIGGTLRHGGNKVLRWMASNVVREQDAAGNIKPSKAKSAEKIDGIVAAIMAIGVASATPAGPQWGVLV